MPRAGRRAICAAPSSSAGRASILAGRKPLKPRRVHHAGYSGAPGPRSLRSRAVASEGLGRRNSPCESGSQSAALGIIFAPTLRAASGRTGTCGRPRSEPPPRIWRRRPMNQKFSLNVNGKVHTVEADADTPLLYVLRDDLALNNPHFGCGLSQCGACTVHLDGKPTRSCATPLSDVGNKKIVTLAGLGTADKPHPLQAAYVE